MQSHECPQGVVKQPYGNTAYLECELCTMEGFAHGCGGVVRVLRSCVRRCRDTGVVSTKSDENETEPPNLCPHLFWGVMGRAVNWIVAVQRHGSSRPRCLVVVAWQKGGRLGRHSSTACLVTDSMCKPCVVIRRISPEGE